MLTNFPVPDIGSPYFQAALAIYMEAFANDERVDFEWLLGWLGRGEAGVQGGLWVFQDGSRTVAIGSAAYFPDQRMGYLPYLAVDHGLRGHGYGRDVTEFLLDWIWETAHAHSDLDPRLTLWDVRDPDETADPAERTIRNRRIDFYCRLGAEILPIAYTYPPVADGQPAVADCLMAYTYPPGGRITRREALDAAWVGLILINHYTPDSIYYKEALASIDLNWPEG
jgi:GNAT superfamily N-acetyltransferase